MTARIFTRAIDSNDFFVELPAGARVVDIKAIYARLMLFAVGDPDAPMVNRRGTLLSYAYETDKAYDANGVDGMSYVGSVLYHHRYVFVFVGGEEP